MAHLIAVVSLGVVLTATALIWKNWGPRSDVTGDGPTSLSINDLASKVDPQSLPEQEMVDRSTVYTGKPDH